MNIITTNLQWQGELKYGNQPNLIVLHHAEAENCTIEDIHQWHIEKGWCGVGYHFLVRKDGTIYSGRPENAIGAHCLGYNTNSLGICAEGNFMIEAMNEVQKNSIIQLIQYLCGKYGIRNIKGHRELNTTACPGVNYPLDVIRQNGFVKSSAVPTPSASNSTNSVVTSIQHLCNSLGIRDKNGNELIEDGIRGDLTNSAVEKLSVLRRGSSGEFVRWLQQRLIALGYSCGAAGVDGDFGFNTLTAVQHFQASRGLSADGIVGQLTLNELLK